MKTFYTLCFFLLISIAGLAQRGIEWVGGNYPFGGIVMSHPGNMGLADTIIIEALNRTDQPLVFKSNVNVLNTDGYYFNCPLRIEEFERFKVEMAISNRYGTKQLIEFVNKQLVFPSDTHGTSVLNVQYFLVDDDVVVVKRDGQILEYRGFDRMQVPIRLVMDEQGKPVRMEQYHPQTGKAIGKTISVGANQIWITDYQAKVIALDVKCIDMDSIYAAQDLFHHRERTHYFSEVVLDFNKIEYWKDGVSEKTSPVSHLGNGRYLMEWKTGYDSIVFRTPKYRQVWRSMYIPDYMNEFPLHFYKGKRPLLKTGSEDMPYEMVNGAYTILWSDNPEDHKGYVNPEAFMNELQKELGEKIFIMQDQFVLNEKYKKEWSNILKVILSKPIVGHLSQHILHPNYTDDTYALKEVYVTSNIKLSYETWVKLMSDYGLKFSDFYASSDPNQIRAIVMQRTINHQFYETMNKLAAHPDIKMVQIGFPMRVELD